MLFLVEVLSFSFILVPIERSLHLIECLILVGRMLDHEVERSTVTRNG
jgi:hypothetical protein